MSIVVLEPGIESRIVDFGRPRTRSLGVPVGGAADRRSLTLGNALVGNASDAPALEIAMKGPRLRAESDIGAVLYGAPFDAHLDGYPIETDRTFMWRAGVELHVGGTRQGARAYLCVRGGFNLSAILASRSALAPIRKADVLSCESSVVGAHYCPDLLREFPDTSTVSILPGPQASWFREAELLSQTFVVTPASNRMGMRLSGAALTMPQQEMVSEPVCPGSIQVTRDGQCIILGVDGQTIGGYPKIAQVIQADLDTLGQMRPGHRLKFAAVSMDAATQRARQKQSELRASVMRLQVSLDAFSAERRFAAS